MINKKFLVIFIILFILFPTISINVASLDNMDSVDDNIKKSPLVDLFLRLRFRLGFYPNLYSGRYFARQLRPPVPLQPYPSTVELNYLNKTSVQIGGKSDTGEWEKLVKISGTYDWGWMSPTIIYTFELQPPENAEDDVFNVIFDPEKLVMKTNKENLNWPGAEQPIRTNMTIFLKPSVDPSFPTRDIVLKVNIVREEILDKVRILTGPPRYPITYKDEYLEKQGELKTKNIWWASSFNMISQFFLGRFTILAQNLPLPSYDKWIDSTVDVLVKVNPFHLLEIPPLEPLEISPYEVKSIPLTIINTGSHIDTFNFRVNYDNEEMVVTPPPAMTLKPGEEGQALVGVAAPKQFLSVGSTTLIDVEAYSVDDPDSVFSNTITLITTGVYAAGSSTYIVISVFITLIIILFIIVVFFRKRRDKYAGKPDKPWKILEERKHLEELKKKDSKEYNETLEMMKSEYESSLLWHKYYVDAAIHKKIEHKRQKQAKKKQEKLETKAKIKDEKEAQKLKEIEEEKAKEKEQEKSKKKEAVDFKEIEPESPKEKEQEVSLLDRRSDLEKRKKEITISRVKRQQDKQKRKYKSSV